jgi:acetoin utilization deacetylase AcuC-like enzyme
LKLPVPVVWSDNCLRHEPAGEVWLGVREPGTEVPVRALVLRDALTAAGAPIVSARPHGDEILLAVHDPGLLDHLARIWAAWERGGYPVQHGRDRVVPYVFPTPGMLAGLELRTPPAAHGRAGQYCYDTTP